MSDPRETSFYVDPTKRSIALPGLAADKFYSLAVRGYRRVDKDINASGVIFSDLVRAKSWRYQPSTTVAFNGDVTGTIQGVSSLQVVTDLRAITSDGFLSRPEKQHVVLAWSNLHSQMDAAASKAVQLGGLDSFVAAAAAALAALDTYLNQLSPAWNDLGKDTPVDPQTFQNAFAAAQAQVADLIAMTVDRASQLASWSGIKNDDGKKPEDNATNSANPLSPLGPNGTVGDAIKRLGDLAGALAILADSPDESGLLDGAKALVEQVRVQQVTALASQLLAEARKERFEALSHLEGVPMGTQVKRVERQAIEGDTLLAEKIDTVSAATGEVARQLAAQVTRIDRAIVDGDSAQAESLAQARAQLGNDLAAAVTRLDRAIVDGDSAQAQALSTVKAEIEQAVGAEVTRLDRAIVDGDSAQAQALSTVKAQFGDDLSSAVTNLEEAIADGDSASATALQTVRATIEDSLSSEVARLDKAIVDGDHAQAEAIVQVTAHLSNLDADVTRIDKAIVDGDQAQAQALTNVRVEIEDAVEAEVARVDKAIIDGDSAQALAVQQVRADLGNDLSSAVTRIDKAISDGDAASALALQSVKAELEGDASAESARVDQAILNGDRAQAESVEQVKARVGVVEASVTQQAGAIVDLQGRVVAYLQFEVEAGTGRAIMRLAADGQDGSKIDFVANALRFSNPVDGKLITAMRVANGNVEVSNDLLMGSSGHIISRYGEYMTVTGAPFGNSAQFVEWYGPAKASLSECTAADAISYKTVNGGAYFGGSLSGGVLRNASRTSALIGTANVTTGNFGSNGGPRVVVVSLNFYGDTTIDGPCPVADQPYAKVQLWRGVDAETGTLLVEQTFYGTHECMPGHGADEPGTMIDQLSSGFTFTDNTGGTTAAYFTRIVERSTNVLPIRQELSIVSTEE